MLNRLYIKTIIILLVSVTAIVPVYLSPAAAGENIYSVPGNKKDMNNNSGGEEKTDKNADRRNKFLIASCDLNANTKDAFLGLTAGINILEGSDLYLGMFFYFRPYKRSVFIEMDNNHYYQVQEDRYVIGAGLEKHLYLNDFTGIFINAGIGYTWGEYAGTTWEGISSAAPSAGIGMITAFYDIILIKIGYLYIRIPNMPDNRGTFSIVMNL